MARQIRILLADDHAVVRDGLRALLERQSDMAVVAEAGDGRECVQMAENHLPDVVLMDVAMPEMNGIEAARRIIAASPKTGVVMLSMHRDESYVLRSLKAGARGYLLKDSPREDVLSAVRAASEGRSFLSRTAHRPRARNPAVARGGQSEQGRGPSAEHQPDHGGDAPGAYSAEALSA
jgi:two-component system response regulator NreC